MASRVVVVIVYLFRKLDSMTSIRDMRVLSQMYWTGGGGILFEKLAIAVREGREMRMRRLFAVRHNET